ncbi:hypothetical protein HYW19_00705 [Candidatus Woesearchaeota archaeon]|nr:hypothetical protein [Candidatus Woesearchaeota archaeon]
MDSPLLASIDKGAIKTFRKDLLQMLNAAKGMDKYYFEAKHDFHNYLEKFESLVDGFNKKYKGIKLKIAKKTEEMELKILLNEKNVKDCFANSVSKIVGLQAVGASGFGAATISDTAAFSGEVERAKSKLYITYYNPQTGTTNIFLKYDGKEKKVELVYDIEEIQNEPSPEFQLAAYYALSLGYSKKIDLHDEAGTLGFSYIPYPAEKAKFHRKFNPHAGE